MQLQLCTWQEVESYLTLSRGIVIPIGSTEQHGPNGFVGTDALCPEVLARGLGEATGALVAPTLSIGMAQHHLAFPGSIAFRPSTLMAVVQDVVNSLARHGFDSFFFLNGHGGNIASLQAAFSEIYAETSLGTAGSNRPALRCYLRNWWEGPKVKALSSQLFGAAEGSHATCSEVSLTYYAYPDHVKSAAMTPETAPSGPIYDADDFRRRHPDGRMGSNPALASVEAGEKLYQGALDDIIVDYQAFIEGRSG
ncbi:MAG TPA: creatininase family protein [Kiloniellaceae bacterium]|nr:creatininase family protein [Kiloniellaceae bacterium]